MERYRIRKRETRSEFEEGEQKIKNKRWWFKCKFTKKRMKLKKNMEKLKKEK